MNDKKIIVDNKYPLDAELLESFHQTFFYFINLLDLLALNNLKSEYFLSNDILIAELRSDILNDTKFLLSDKNTILNKEEKYFIFNMYCIFYKSPESLNFSTFIEVKDYEFWSSVKNIAIVCQLKLTRAIKANKEFW